MYTKCQANVKLALFISVTIAVLCIRTSETRDELERDDNPGGDPVPRGWLSHHRPLLPDRSSGHLCEEDQNTGGLDEHCSECHHHLCLQDTRN